MKKSILALIICFALCGGLVFVAKKVRDKRLNLYNPTSEESDIGELNTLETKKTQINRKIKSLRADIEKNTQGKGTISFICVGAHKKAYSIVFKRAQEKGYKGVIVLNDKYKIGFTDCMSADQFKEMVDAGWEVAVSFSSKNSDPMASVRSLIAEAEKYGAKDIKTVYFERDGYSTNYDSELLYLGIENAVYHGEDKKTTSEFLYPDDPEDTKLWKPMSLGYATSGKSSFISSLQTARGSLLFDIGFDSSYIASYCTDYGISNLFTVIGGSDFERIGVYTVDGSHQYILSISSEAEKENSKIRSQISDYEAQLAEIEKKIDELKKSIGT